LTLAIALPDFARAQNAGCGPIANAFGPFDYRTDRDKLPIVEERHFDAGVEALVASNHGASVGADLDYTLRAFPNHYRALLAMVRLGERLKTPQPPGANYTIECYFVRAEEFRPKDVIVRILHATYLNKQGHRDAAMSELAIGQKLAGDDGFTHYNLGLAYLELGAYKEAVAQAHRAADLGFDRPELKDRLVAAGQWTEPEKASAADVAAGPASAASAP